MRFALIIFSFLTGFVTLGAQSLPDLDRASISNYLDEYTLQEQFYTAENALKFGLFDSAVRIYEKILRLNENNESLFLNTSDISLATIRFSLAKSLIGKRDFLRASEVLNQIEKEDRKDTFNLYRLIVDYFLNYDFSKKELLNLIKDSFKGLELEALTDHEKVWYYYFQATIDLLENKKSSVKNSLFLAKRYSEKNLSQKAFFESLLLRLDYNQQKPDNSVIKRLGKLLRSKESKNESYHYAYDYAFLLALRGDRNLAIEVINNQLAKGVLRYSAFELDNLRLLKVIVLGLDNTSSRDLLFTLIQSSNDNLILGRSFQLLERYLYKDEDIGFLEVLSQYFELQKSHPLRSKYYFLKANLSLRRLQKSIDSNDKESRLLALNQLKSDSDYILENFPATNSISEIYQMLTYVALNQEEPQYRLAAGYLSKILVTESSELGKLKLNNFIGNFYFLNGDYEVASDSYKDAIEYRHLLDVDARGKLWFSLLTAQIRSNTIDKGLLELVESEASSGLIPFEYYLKIKWNYALFLRVLGDLESAISVVENTIKTKRFDSLPISLSLQFRWLSLYLKNQSGNIDNALIEDASYLINLLESLDENQIKSSLSTTLQSQIRLLKAQLLIRLNNPNEGFLAIESLQNDFPQTQASEHSYIILANYYANLEEYGLAETVLLELAELYPESNYAPQALLEAAINLGKLGSERYRQAIQLLGQLVKNYDSSPIVYFALRHQGDLLRKASDFSAALSVYDSLIQKYPNHSNRYLAELSRLDCMLALANEQNSYEYKEIILQLERLLDLPNLPQAFRFEVIYKLAFLWVKVEQLHLAKALIIEEVVTVLGSNHFVEEMTEIDRYWVARSFFLLSELLEKKGSTEECKKIYRLIIAYNLPGSDLAKELLKDI